MIKRGSSEWKEKISKSLKGRKVWNKGLKGMQKGSSTSFKKGHIPWSKGKIGVLKAWNKGIPRDEETKRKISETKRIRRNTYKLQIEENNPMWKGDMVGYGGVHRWIRNKRGRADKCEKCGAISGLTKHGRNNIQYANLSGEYKRNITDWIALCISCHSKLDNKVMNFNKPPLQTKSNGVL
jgi:hypothetical protein